MKFKYKDYSKATWQGGKLVAPVIFEVEAGKLTEADELYKKQFGQDVTRQKHIAVDWDKT